MNIFNIIVLAGYSGAGKTTIAKEISKNNNVGFIEHQKLVHDMAVSKGYVRARCWLKDVGIDQFVRQSTHEMTARLSSFQNLGLGGAIIDVAYGKKMLLEIAEQIPNSKTCVISVRTDKEIRESRIAGRMGGVEQYAAYNEREFRDEFLIKTGLQELIEAADFEIVNNGNLRDTIDQLERGFEAKNIKFVE